jgi:CRP-like cAMP-binding protein
MLMQANGKNAFLALLSPPDFALFRPHLTNIELRLGERLHSRNAAVDQVIFPHSGLVALTIPLPERSGAGAILVGRDGIVGGLAAAAAAPAACDAEVYVAGHASRVSAPALRYVLEQSASVRRLAARFDTALFARAHQTALCNAAHPVEARLCRWLLEVQDRSGSSDVPLTQSTLAQMLGVRRTTVTLTAGQLEAAGLVKCMRGHLHIIDRPELDRRSCGCHRQATDYADRLLAEFGYAGADVAAPPPVKPAERQAI